MATWFCHFVTGEKVEPILKLVANLNNVPQLQEEHKAIIGKSRTIFPVVWPQPPQLNDKSAKICHIIDTWST